MRGRKAEPAEIKELKGNPGKRAIVKAPGDQRALAAEPPAFVAASDMAAEIWSRLWREHAAGLKILRATDREVFARYCVYMAEWVEACRQLADEDVTYLTETRHGTMKRINPLFTVRERLESNLIRIEAELGLTPRSRQSILQSMAAVAQPALPLGDLSGAAEPAEGEDDRPAPGGVIGALSSAIN